MLMDVLARRLSRSTFYLLFLRNAGDAGWRDLLATIHTGHLVEVMWETKITRLLIFDYLGGLERMVRPAITSVPSGVTHSD